MQLDLLVHDLHGYSQSKHCLVRISANYPSGQDSTHLPVFECKNKLEFLHIEQKFYLPEHRLQSSLHLAHSNFSLLKCPEGHLSTQV